MISEFSTPPAPVSSSSESSFHDRHRRSYYDAIVVEVVISVMLSPFCHHAIAVEQRRSNNGNRNILHASISSFSLSPSCDITISSSILSFDSGYIQRLKSSSSPSDVIIVVVVIIAVVIIITVKLLSSTVLNSNSST